MNIREVAKRAQVSTATVSRTINTPSAVDPETARRVWQAIEELRYYPNSQARSLVSGRSRILGLIVSDITNPFFPEIVKGFEEAAIAHGYEILVSSTNYDPGRMALCVRRMIERKVDGVAIMTSEMEPALTDQFAERNVPLVFLDVGDVTGTTSNLRVDYAQGINEAVVHLLGLGHRLIGFISGPLTLKSARVRRAAFLQCLFDHGIIEDERYIAEGDHTIDGGLRAMTHLLQLPKAPTAVLSSNDLTAIGAMRAVRRAGLRVPEDVSVIGFDDIHLAGFTEPPLTTIRLSPKQVADGAFHALLPFMVPQAAAPERGTEAVIETRLVLRESTAACSAKSASQA